MTASNPRDLLVLNQQALSVTPSSRLIKALQQQQQVVQQVQVLVLVVCS